MKICITCKEELSLDKFSKNSTKRDGLQNKCRECTKTYYKNYYETSPKEKSRIRSNNKVSRLDIQRIVREKKSVPCTDCKIAYPYYVMDFDHMGDKEFNIGNAVNRNVGLARVLAEIDKCEVVCSNCHRIRTHGRTLGGGGMEDPPSFDLG